MVAEAESNQISGDTRTFEVENTGGVPFQPAPAYKETAPIGRWMVLAQKLNRPIFRHLGSVLTLSAIALLVFLAIQNQSQPDDGLAGQGQAAESADVAPASPGEGDGSPSSGQSERSSDDPLPSESASATGSSSQPGSSANADRFTLANADDEGTDGSESDDAEESAASPTAAGNDESEGEASTEQNEDRAAEEAGSDGQDGEPGADGNDGDAENAPRPQAPSQTGTDPVDEPNGDDAGSGSKPQAPTPGVAAPEVEAISPGTLTNSGLPLRAPTSIAFRASGTPQPLQFQYRIYIFENGTWQLERTSSWKGTQWTADVAPFAGRDIRWTVTGRNEAGILSEESAPRYVRIDRATEPATPTVVSSNGSFEKSGVGPAESARLQSSQVPKWKSGSGRIELRGTGLNGIEADKGSVYLFLARAQSVEQTFATVPGETIEWSISHRSGDGAGGAIISIGPAEGSTFNQGQLVSNSTWVRQSGAYTVPAGQTTTRFVVIGTGAETLIDNVRIVRK